MLAIIDAVFFQFMFTVKDEGFFKDRYFAQQLYISSEFILAVLSFSYSGAYFPDVYNYYIKRNRNIP